MKRTEINKRDSNGLKQGYWVEKNYMIEKKVSEGNYIDGVKDGEWKTTTSKLNNLIKKDIKVEFGVYKGGEKYGLWLIYNNHTLVESINYMNGELSGERRVYGAMTGDLLSISNYVNNRVHGKILNYNSGVLTASTNYHNGDRYGYCTINVGSLRSNYFYF